MSDQETIQMTDAARAAKAAYMRAWRNKAGEAYRERKREYSRKYRETHREVLRERSKVYRARYWAKVAERQSQDPECR